MTFYKNYVIIVNNHHGIFIEGVADEQILQKNDIKKEASCDASWPS